MTNVMGDVQYSLRLLRRSPVFTAVAVMSLALGIGANAAILNLLNAIVLRPLPVRDPGSLVSIISLRTNGTRGGVSFPVFEELGRRQRSLSGWIGYWGDGVYTSELNGAFVQTDVWAVTGNFFSELGVRPFSGRLLTPADVDLERRTPAMVAVIGHGLWRRAFGGAPSVVGRVIRVEGIAFTIVGVAPEGFTAVTTATEPDVTIPLTALPLLTANTDRFTNLKVPWVSMLGRLRSSVTLDQARADFEALWPPIRTAMTPPDYNGRERGDFLATRVEVASAARGIEYFLRSRFTRPLEVLLGVSALILSIACVNLAGLSLSRAAAREPEMAIRAALGGSRWRLARQMLIDGLVVSAVAAFGAVLFAAWGSRALMTLMTREYLVPTVLRVAPDARVLAFTSAIAMIVGLLFSIAPAWRVGRLHPAVSLQQTGRTVSRTGRFGKVLIVAQVALSLALLVDATLLVRTLQQLDGVALGFRVEGVSAAKLFAQPGGYRDFDPGRYYPALIDRVAALPGVRDAALTQVRPSSGFVLRETVASLTAADVGVSSAFAPIGPHFFTTLGIPLLAGRDFAWADNAGTRRVVIVSRSLADRLFSGASAVGRHVRASGDPSRADLEIVGVAGNVRIVDSRDSATDTLYVPLLQEPAIAKFGDLLIRADPVLSVAAVGDAIRSLGREYMLWYRPYQAFLDRAILQERITAMLAAFFGALALLLAAIGVYGLVAYDVAQRSREMGIRIALGAARGQVVGMVTREATAMVLLGIAIGTPMAVVAARLVASLLFGLAPTDVVTFAVVAVALVAVGAFSAFVPGWRAGRIDPAHALRS